MTGQSPRSSFVESLAGTLIGFGVAIAANWYLLPLWGFHPDLSQSASISVLFTGISLARGYLIRRLFNYLHYTGVLS